MAKRKLSLYRQSAISLRWQSPSGETIICRGAVPRDLPSGGDIYSCMTGDSEAPCASRY